MPDQVPLIPAGRIAWAAASFLAATATLVVASHHPLWPAPLVAGLAAWMIAAYRFPLAWWFVLPACLPAMNFSPWTGWIGLEELDLLVGATLAGGYARLAHPGCELIPPLSPRGRAVVWGIAVLTGLGVWRGVVDAGGAEFGWYQGHVEPLNSLRVGKSVVHALLLLPLVRRAVLADSEGTFRRFALGMCAGGVVLALAVLWERGAFPGLFNVAAHYRTVGLFWEMHVGGAAIDAYVVLCTPFVLWSLWEARSRLAWAAAALFALVWAYVSLTTFSRGAYLGVAIGLLILGFQLPAMQGRRSSRVARALVLVLGTGVLCSLALNSLGYGASALMLLALGAALWWRWRAHSSRRQRKLAVALLTLALVFEAVIMLGPDSFMSARLARSGLDYDSRAAHWQRGLALLQAPSAWLLGLGLGRLPAHYDRFAPRGEFPGGVKWLDDGANAGHARLAGPRSRPDLGGRFGLTQRVPLRSAYRLQLDLRAGSPVDLLVRVCESHLLYDRACQWAFLRFEPGEGVGWQRRQFALKGPPLAEGQWFAPRQGVLTMSVLNVGGRIDVDNAVLEAADGEPLLTNGDFSDGMAHWMPAAQGYFVPWHIDNMVLELLIERGLLGTLLLMGLVVCAIRRLARSPGPRDTAAPFLAAALGGVLCVGLVSSVLDVPRVALLLALLLAMTCLLERPHIGDARATVSEQ